MINNIKMGVSTFLSETGSGQPVSSQLLSAGLGKTLAEGFQAVILAAGDFPYHVIPLRILREADNLVVCDGALEELLEYEIEPAAVVGDGDSLSAALKQRYAHIYHQISEQEFNDLTKATLFARSHLQMDASTHIRPVSATSERPESGRTTRWATSPLCSITIDNWESTR